MKRVIVTKADTTLSACLRRVYQRHESFELVKNGVPYARLVPVEKAHGTTHDLAEALASGTLGAKDRVGWAGVLANGRRCLKPLPNPWG